MASDLGEKYSAGIVICAAKMTAVSVTNRFEYCPCENPQLEQQALRGTVLTSGFEIDDQRRKLLAAAPTASNLKIGHSL